MFSAHNYKVKLLSQAEIEALCYPVITSDIKVCVIAYLLFSIHEGTFHDVVYSWDFYRKKMPF